MLGGLCSEKIQTMTHNIIMYPMTYCSLKKGERTVSLVWANSSGLILYVEGDLPETWVRTDATLAITRLLSAGWVETGRGKVEE
jgi:hypothetical protein